MITDMIKIYEVGIIMINVIEDHMITMINVEADRMINMKDDHTITMITEDDQMINMTEDHMINTIEGHMTTKEDQRTIMIGVTILVIASMVSVDAVATITGVEVMNRGRQKGRHITRTRFGTTVGTHCKCRKKLTRWKNGVDIS